jgi:predicted aldo/keto reductase-like oxidoreductase
MTPDWARGFIGPAVEKAKTCLKCGDCVKRCPYNLDIPSLIKERIKDWERLS